MGLWSYLDGVMGPVIENCLASQNMDGFMKKLYVSLNNGSFSIESKMYQTFADFSEPQKKEIQAKLREAASELETIYKSDNFKKKIEDCKSQAARLPKPTKEPAT